MWSSSVKGLVLPFLDCTTLECALSSQGCFVLLSQNCTRYLLGDHCCKMQCAPFLSGLPIPAIRSSKLTTVTYSMVDVIAFNFKSVIAVITESKITAVVWAGTRLAVSAVNRILSF